MFFDHHAFAFALIEKRRKRFVLHGPQKPLTRCCRWQIQSCSSPPGAPDGAFLARLKQRDSKCEVIYDPLTANWHLYMVTRSGGTRSCDLLTRQDIDFNGRPPGEWLIHEMDARDRWRKHGSAKAAWNADMQGERDNDERMEKADEEWVDGVAGEWEHGHRCVNRASIVIP